MIFMEFNEKNRCAYCILNDLLRIGFYFKYEARDMNSRFLSSLNIVFLCVAFEKYKFVPFFVGFFSRFRDKRKILHVNLLLSTILF